jgi:hypothetical protein
MRREPQIADETQLEIGDAHAVVEPQFLLPTMSMREDCRDGTMTDTK